MGLKETYQEKLASQLKEWRAKLEELKGKAAQTGAAARNEINKQVDALRPRIEAAEQKLKDLQAAGGGAWEKIKESAEKDLESFKKIWESMKKKLD